MWQAQIFTLYPEFFPGLLSKGLYGKALEKKITEVYFDRGKYQYHGRIKTFAEALRKNGLIF